MLAKWWNDFVTFIGDADTWVVELLVAVGIILVTVIIGIAAVYQQRARVREAKECLERGGTIIYSDGSYAACAERK